MTLDRQALIDGFAAIGFIADPQLAMAVSLMRTLERPLLLEGDAGVGKTEVAKALSAVIGAPLIRLQCYEGLDVNAAVYEWIDEIDRADEAFEAYLLEILSDFQVSIPELGTVKATSIPHVVLTSNGTRELSDALRRRCLYHYVDYPSEDKELRIVLARVPGIATALAAQIVRFVQALRREDLRKKPGIAETLDWAAALVGLGVKDLRDDPEALYATLLCLLKTNQDRQAMPADMAERLAAKLG